VVGQIINCKKGLEIPCRSSESANRRTDTTLAKSKRTKGVWRYQRGNQVSQIEAGHTTQCPKEKHKERSINHYTDWATRTSLNTGGELRCSERVSNLCPTCGTCRVTLFTNLAISHEWGNDWEVSTTKRWNKTVVISDTDIPQQLTRSSQEQINIYKENLRLSHTNPTKNRSEQHVCAFPISIVDGSPIELSTCMHASIITMYQHILSILIY
jgi:hypothetical protein